MVQSMWTCVVFALLACDGGNTAKSREQLKKEYGPKLEARLAKLAAANTAGIAGKAALGTPGDSTVKLVLDRYGARVKERNTILAHTEDIDDATKPRKSEETEQRDRNSEQLAPDAKLIFSYKDQNEVFIAKSLLGVEKEFVRANEDDLRALVDAEYVLIVYPRLMKPAVELMGKFEAGRATGTVVLVEIETGKLLGGFEFAAESSNEVEYTTSRNTGTSTAKQNLRYDLYQQTAKAIKQGIETRWPGSSTPSDWGY